MATFQFQIVLLLLAFIELKCAAAPWSNTDATFAYDISPRQSSGVNATVNIPPPQLPIVAWVAFGDSFSAGPGAGPAYQGDTSDCMRRTGAYAPLLSGSSLFYDGFKNPTMNFLSCTGDVTTEVRDNQIPAVGSTLPFMGLITLSIGGNDVGFGKILKACVFIPLGGCQTAIDDARKILYEGTLFDNYNSMMAPMITDLNWCPKAVATAPRAQDCFSMIYQTAYPSFFESYTTQCNTIGFTPVIGGWSLTQQLRKDLNQLGQELNAWIAYYIANVNQQQRLTRNGGLADFMVFADQGERYAGHRFCRADVTEPDRDNANTWFFNYGSKADPGNPSEASQSSLGNAADYTVIDPNSCSDTAEIGDQLDCGISELVASGVLAGDAQVPAFANKEAKTKTFHPKTSGFGAVSAELQQRLTYVSSTTPGRGCPSFMGLNLRIVGIGDQITSGLRSGDGQGYFSDLAVNLAVVLPPCVTNTFTFIGSQMSGNVHNEGYPGLTVAGIQAKVQSSGTLSQRPNLILLMAGTNDIFQGLDPQDTVNALSSFVDYLFQACPDATILVQHIPMIGYQDFSRVMSTVQRNVIKYNAAISAMVDTRIAQGQHITKIHSRTTTFDHASGDTVVPNDSGYELMAEAWTERISVVKQNGWIDDPYVLPGTPGNGTNGTTGGLLEQIALASYIHPLSDPDAWNRMINYPSNKVSVLVANVLNGPDTTVNLDWERVISRASNAGKRVIGYVRTGYLGVSIQQFQTRLGSTDLADWVSQIETDVDLWYQLYPGMISGIFFDEGWNDCGPNNQYSELYRFISDNTKRKYPGAFTVLNPGATMPQCFEHSADTLMTFESSYETYTNNYIPNPNWTPSDIRKIWHIIYNVPAGSAGDVARLARDRGAGLIHITDDTLDNPYDTLPADSYMETLINIVDGGHPLVAGPTPFSTNGQPASQPASISVTGSDYSSVSLSWGASGSPYAFAVLLSGREVVRLPGTMSQVTIGNINPGSSGLSFTLRAIGGDGSETGDSASASTNTLSLPNNQAIANIHASPSTTSTIIKADILVPYAFLRIFITDPDTHCSLPAWPINYDPGDFICTHYMVEGEGLFQYSGANLTNGETNYPWTWTWIGYAPITRNGYTYSWNLPIGSSTVDPNYFVVQGQGYGPSTNVFHPCPSTWDSSTSNTGAFCTGQAPYDCKGEILCSTMKVKWCDEAVNNMERGSKIYTSNGAALAVSGNCWANAEQFGCSVQIRGTDQNNNNCQITGDDMWAAYQDIRNIGGCSKCGSKHFGNGCLVSIDYYYGCDNRDSGADRRGNVTGIEESSFMS